MILWKIFATYSCQYTLCLWSIGRLRIAFKWLIRAFSGYLSSEQVLMLWDRIIAYNSLEILPGKYCCFHNYQ